MKKVAETNKDESYFDANNQMVPDQKDLICRYCLMEDCGAEKGSIDNV